VLKLLGRISFSIAGSFLIGVAGLLVVQEGVWRGLEGSYQVGEEVLGWSSGLGCCRRGLKELVPCEGLQVNFSVLLLVFCVRAWELEILLRVVVGHACTFLGTIHKIFRFRQSRRVLVLPASWLREVRGPFVIGTSRCGSGARLSRQVGQQRAEPSSARRDQLCRLKNVES